MEEKIKILYNSFFGTDKGLEVFLNPKTPLQYFNAGWKLERLQKYALKNEDPDSVVLLEDMRLTLISRAVKTTIQ